MAGSVGTGNATIVLRDGEHVPWRAIVLGFGFGILSAHLPKRDVQFVIT
jgi:hypothetical protein